MNKRRWGKRRLLAAMLCSVLIVMETVPSAGFWVQASEPETGQEDFFTVDNTRGGYNA